MRRRVGGVARISKDGFRPGQRVRADTSEAAEKVTVVDNPNWAGAVGAMGIGGGIRDTSPGACRVYQEEGGGAGVIDLRVGISRTI